MPRLTYEQLVSKYESMLEYERGQNALGYHFAGGIDEAGRGPLAGPVVAACCILDPDRGRFTDSDDSKKLTGRRGGAFPSSAKML